MAVFIYNINLQVHKQSLDTAVMSSPASMLTCVWQTCRRHLNNYDPGFSWSMIHHADTLTRWNQKWAELAPLQGWTRQKSASSGYRNDEKKTKCSPVRLKAASTYRYMHAAYTHLPGEIDIFSNTILRYAEAMDLLSLLPVVGAGRHSQ